MSLFAKIDIRILLLKNSVLPVMVIIITFMSCTKAPNISNEIMGEWKTNSYLKVYNNDTVQSQTEMNFTFRKDSLKICFFKSDCGIVPYKLKFNILTFNGDTFDLTTLNDSTLVYIWSGEDIFHIYRFQKVQ